MDSYQDRQWINSFKDQFQNWLISSYKDVYTINYPFTIQVSNEARQAAIEFSSRNAAQAKTLHPYMDSFMSKLAGTACRYAGIILLSDPTQKEMVITKAHMDLAIQIASLSIDHARYAIEPIGLQSLEPAIKLEAWYKSRNKCLFSYREAKQGLSSSYNKENVYAALDLLCLQHHLAMIPGPDRSDYYVVHPGIVHPSNLPLDYQFHYQEFLSQQHQLIQLPPLQVQELLPPPKSNL
jgi:hypothetical protein